MQYREIFSDRLAQGSEARGANLARAKALLEQPQLITETKSEMEGRGSSIIRIAALPLVLVFATSFVGARPANADENQPVLTGPKDKMTAIAPFHEAGQADDFYGPQGLEACGVSWPGPVVLTAVANEDEMGLNVSGIEVYADPFKVEGSGYEPRAQGADKAMRAKVSQVVARFNRAVRGVTVILTRDAGGQQTCGLVSDTDTEKPVVTPPVAVLQPSSEVVVTPITTNESCVGIAESVPGTHVAVPVANLDASAPQGVWIRPVYNQAKADAAHNWEGIGPWAPISFASEPGAAHLKTFGNLGEFIIVGDNGGKVWLGVWQEAQHQNETKMKPDGTLNPAWQNQYTIDGLPVGAQVIPFDPDTGKQLTWPDGTPIVWAAGPLGTFSMGLPAGEVRAGLCFTIPGQIPGVQKPEIKVYRGPNDEPGLKGENQLPNTSQVVKPGMPD